MPLTSRRGVVRVGRTRAFIRYLRDPNASVIGKLFVALAVVYIAVPFDLIPDVPIVGWLDDLGVATVTLAWLGRVLGRYRDLPGQADVEGKPAPIEEAA